MDFYPVMMNITFSPDNQSSLINIEVINDSEIETNETFTLLLTSFSSDVIIDTPNATVTIVDDDSNNYYDSTCSPNYWLALWLTFSIAIHYLTTLYDIVKFEEGLVNSTYIHAYECYSS